MLYDLSLRMGRPVSELYPTMTADELCHWAAKNREMPIGDERLDWLFANLCSVVCNVAGAKRRGGGPFKPEDFLIFKKPAPKTPLQAMTKMLGHRVVKGKRKES